MSNFWGLFFSLFRGHPIQTLTQPRDQFGTIAGFARNSLPCSDDDIFQFRATSTWYTQYTGSTRATQYTNHTY